jgi:hypothetical protein
MAEEGRYTREQQEDTLAGLSIIREAHAGGVAYAAQDAMRQVAEIAAGWDETTDAHALARMVAGLTNAAGLLLNWIEAEAEHRSELVGRIEQKYPLFEIDYTPDPSWATWSGVMRALEKTVTDTPLKD